MLNQFSISMFCTIITIVIVGLVVDNHYNCDIVNHSLSGACMTAKSNIILFYDFIVVLLGTPLIIQGYRFWRDDRQVKLNAIGLIDRMEEQ